MKTFCANREGGIGILNRWRFAPYSFLAACLLSPGSMASAQQTLPDTFAITASLSSPTIHVGEHPIVEIITANPTDHIVYASRKIDVEIIDSKGEDIAPRAVREKRDRDITNVLNSMTDPLSAGRKQPFTLNLKPEPGYLMPGVYRLRISRGNVKNGVDVYSNAVTLTVVP